MQQDALTATEARLTARLAVEADAAAPLTVELAVTTPDGTALPPVRRTVSSIRARVR
ncbi:hypothetical protein ACFS32_19445 [Novosphingobium pokkalii]|uniref:hypothetical protein n=1 Tax=Novosphingobium pokkalii TaxID=1770194 RepID=UPI0036441A97